MTDRVLTNTLYVLTQGAYLHREHQCLKVEAADRPEDAGEQGQNVTEARSTDIDSGAAGPEPEDALRPQRRTLLEVPIHLVDSVAVFGNVMVSPQAMAFCAEAGVSICFLTAYGRLVARVDAPASGNVLLRRRQFRLADQPEACAPLARAFVMGKLQNARHLLLRAARESNSEPDAMALRQAATHIGERMGHVEKADDRDQVRGLEGDATRAYFGVFSSMIRQQRAHFGITGRNRRPPTDRTNAMLSFLYAVLAHDCVAALTAAGLDPSVGFFHVDRPGRPSLALDLMEEFRPLIVDRVVLSLINRKQVDRSGFKTREGGAVEMSDKTRRLVLSEYQARKQEEVTHPILDQKVRTGDLVFLSAKLLARHIRGDLTEYCPCVMK